MIRYVIALSELGLKNNNLISLLQSYSSDIEKMFTDSLVFEGRLELMAYQEYFLNKDLVNEAERKLLVRAINCLSSREKMIVQMRYGLDSHDGQEKTQKEVADLLGISQSYISRLEKKIMQRLKREMVRFEI